MPTTFFSLFSKVFYFDYVCTKKDNCTTSIIKVSLFRQIQKPKSIFHYLHSMCNRKYTFPPRLTISKFWQGESARRRTSQGANRLGGETAKGRKSQIPPYTPFSRLRCPWCRCQEFKAIPGCSRLRSRQISRAREMVTARTGRDGRRKHCVVPQSGQLSDGSLLHRVELWRRWL